ncbi:MAG: hypothetical protein JWM28_4538 [Chitinophagaceae bacterium]|nr:hypothetical protein [Chitinophagaceae bacterium]
MNRSYLLNYRTLEVTTNPRHRGKVDLYAVIKKKNYLLHVIFLEFFYFIRLI